jgi:hypothetical protein
VDWARWERYAPLSGVAAVVFWVIGVIVTESTNYSDKDTPQEILTVFQKDSNTIIAGGLVFALGVLFFIWFLGSLRARLLLAEGGLGRLSSLVYGSGMLGALCLFFQVAPAVQGAFDEDDLSADTAQSLQTMGEAFFGGTEILLIPMFVAVGLLTLRTHALPVWLGWASLVIALVLAIVPIGWAGLIFLFPLWTVVTGIVAYVRPLPPPGPPPHTIGFVGTEPGPPSA